MSYRDDSRRKRRGEENEQTKATPPQSRRSRSKEENKEGRRRVDENFSSLSWSLLTHKQGGKMDFEQNRQRRLSLDFRKTSLR